MASNCRTKRYTCPAGIWELDNMIGAIVAIRSTGIGNFTDCEASGEYKIKDVIFRVSVDGKTITLVELEGLEGDYFTFKDLEILSIVGRPQESVGCGITIGKNISL